MRNIILIRIGIYLVILGLAGCTSIRYSNIETVPVTNSSNEIVVLSISEKVPEGYIKIADFDYRESWVETYEDLWNKVKKIAFDKNADIVKINEVYTGNKNTKGATTRILGSIYSSGNLDIHHSLDSLNNMDLKENKVLLYFTRNDWGGPSLFDIDLYIDSKYQGKLVKKTAKIIELDKEGEIIISNSQKSKDGLKLKVEYGKKYYIHARQIVNSDASANGLQVGIGGQVFLLKDEKYGLLDFDVIKFNLDFEK